MKYWKATIYNPGPPADMNDTSEVYVAAEDEGSLLMTTLEAHAKPVKAFEEVTKAVYDNNI